MRLTRRARGLVVAGALGGLAVACSSGSDDSPATTTSTLRRPSTTSTVAATSTTGSSTTTSSSTTTTVARQGSASPAEAAQRLFDDWQAGRYVDTSDYATQQAVDELFGNPAGAGLAFQGCSETGSGVASCAWRYEGGGLVMQVERNDTNGWLVQSAGFIAD